MSRSPAALALCAALMTLSPFEAQAQAAFDLSGVHVVAPLPGKAPARYQNCRETWTLRPDGTGRIVSGEEVTDIVWRVEEVEGGRDLVYRPTALDPRPDCGGVANPDTSMEGVRRGVRWIDEGHAEFCGLAFESERIIRRTCWASLERQTAAAD